MPPKSKLKEGESAPATKKPRKTKAKKKTTGADGKEPTSFLSLPAELRNTIYELALVQDKRIKVTPRLKEPKLLSASRQIRAETRKIWYLQNRFEVRVRKCDARLAIAFERHIAQFEVFEDGEWKLETNVWYGLGGSKSWTGLMQWCEELHRHKMYPMEWTDKPSRLGTVVSAAHAIVHVSLRASGKWETCREALNAFRAAIGMLDKAWLKD